MEPYLPLRLRDAAIYDNGKFFHVIRIILSRALRREEGHDRYGKEHTAMDNSKGITVLVISYSQRYIELNDIWKSPKPRST